MDATVLDLRYKMRDVLKALDRREKVNIRYHGKIKGVIIPSGIKEKKKVSEHPFFGMEKGKKSPVHEEMCTLRKNRYDL